jgi:hypothetical protein
MGVQTSEIGYTAATTGRGDHEVHKGHVVALGGEKHIYGHVFHIYMQNTIAELQPAYPYSVQFTLTCQLFERRLEVGMTSYSVRFYLQSVILTKCNEIMKLLISCISTHFKVS